MAKRRLDRVCPAIVTRMPCPYDGATYEPSIVGITSRVRRRALKKVFCLFAFILLISATQATAQQVRTYQNPKLGGGVAGLVPELGGGLRETGGGCLLPDHWLCGFARSCAGAERWPHKTDHRPGLQRPLLLGFPSHHLLEISAGHRHRRSAILSHTMSCSARAARSSAPCPWCCAADRRQTARAWAT